MRSEAVMAVGRGNSPTDRFYDPISVIFVVLIWRTRPVVHEHQHHDNLEQLI